MSTLIERLSEWRSRPSRGQMAQELAELQTQMEEQRFRRYNPVASGVPMTYDRFIYEHNSKLRGDARWDEYKKLVLDPHVQSQLRSVVLPLCNAEWEIVPASDKPRDIEIAEFISANLLGKGTDRFGNDLYMRTPWTTRLREILDMLESGFSMFHLATDIVAGKRIFKNIQWLEPSSVDPSGWVLNDEDDIQEIKRTFQSPEDNFHVWEPVPAEEIALYVWQFKGARYEGQPLTRSMYGAWLRKEYKLRQSAVLAQKLGSPVPVGWYPKGFPASAISDFKNLVKALRGTASAEAYGVGPMGDDGKPPEVKYIGAEHNVDRGFTEIIDSENREIGHGGGDTSSNLGETQSGSKSLGDSKGLKEMEYVEAAAKIICDQELHGVGNLQGPISLLKNWNYGPDGDVPRLACSKINPFAKSAAWEQSVVAWSAGIIPKTPEARRQLVENHLGMNLPDEAYEVEEIIVDDPEDDATDDEKDDDEKEEMGLESKQDFRRRIAPMLEPMEDGPTGANFRARNRLEASMNLAGVSQSFRAGERDFFVALNDINEGMKAELLQRLRDGKINTRNIESQRRSSYSKARQSRTRLVRVGAKVGQMGWNAIKEEVNDAS